MKLSKVSSWMIRQALGTKRGEMVLALLAGPIGMILDMALEGRINEALARLDKTVDAVREVIE